MDPKDLFLSHLEIVDRTCESVCRRNGVFDEDARDFAADVRLKLMEDDYAVIQKFRGMSSFATYLDAVIANQFRDFRIKQWGKWRPSANARRLGPTAVLLERLLYRDGQTFEEACNIIERMNSHGSSRSELRRLAAQLKPRLGRGPQGPAGLDDVPAAERTDAPVLDRERDEAVETATRALERALAALPDEDRLIVRMHHCEGITLADIARQLQLDQKPLYGRMKRLLDRLRAALEADGITGDFLEHPS